jgi:hypothetical protein
VRPDKDLTEAEWLNCSDSCAMFEFLIARARSVRSALPHRQFRLFACACCRQVWDLLPGVASRRAVEVSERFADGLARKSELAQACRAARCFTRALKRAGKGHRAHYLAARLTIWVATDSILDVAGGTATRAEELAAHLGRAAPGGAKAARADESRRQCDLFRDIFDDPFRPTPAVDKACLTWGGGTVPKLAQAIYDGRTFEQVPVLADALEEAGCAEQELLGHLRGPGPHVRVCWALDTLR